MIAPVRSRYPTQAPIVLFCMQHNNVRSLTASINPALHLEIRNGKSGTVEILTRGDRGDLDRHVLTLRLESIRLMRLVTTALSVLCVVTIGLFITASMPTLAGSDDVIG